MLPFSMSQVELSKPRSDLKKNKNHKNPCSWKMFKLEVFTTNQHICIAADSNSLFSSFSLYYCILNSFIVDIVCFSFCSTCTL